MFNEISAQCFSYHSIPTTLARNRICLHAVRTNGWTDSGERIREPTAFLHKMFKNKFGCRISCQSKVYLTLNLKVKQMLLLLGLLVKNNRTKKRYNLGTRLHAKKGSNLIELEPKSLMVFTFIFKVTFVFFCNKCALQ